MVAPGTDSAISDPTPGPGRSRSQRRTVVRSWKKAMIPGTRVVTVEAAGHMLPYEQPDALVRALGDFLG